MGLLTNIGRGVAAVGRDIGLPDLGISELIGGRNATINNTPLANSIQNTNPNLITAFGQGYNYSPPPTTQKTAGQVLGDQTQYFTPTTSAAPTGTTAGISTTPQIVYFNGVPYDINDPAIRQQLLQLRSQQADEYANRDISDYDKQVRDALEAARIQYGNQNNTIGEYLQDIGQNRINYTNDYNRNIKDLNQGYDLGTVNRTNYFNQLSPNAYQSSQADSQQFANNQRNQGLGDLQVAKTQYDSGLSRQENDINTQKKQLEDQYNKYINDTQDSLGRQEQSIRDYYNQQKDQYATDVAQANTKQNVNNFNAGQYVSAYNPLDTPTVDLGKYTQFTNFNQLAASPQANVFQKSAVTPQSQLTAQDSYLGYTPDQKSKNYITDYLRKGY